MKTQRGLVDFITYLLPYYSFSQAEMISELVRKRNVPHYNGGHEMFHDDMIMYANINDQQPVIAMITRSSP